jgi:hypothetical protein
MGRTYGGIARISSSRLMNLMANLGSGMGAVTASTRPEAEIMSQLHIVMVLRREDCWYLRVRSGWAASGGGMIVAWTNR